MCTSVLGKAFGTEKAVSKAIDSVSSGIDKLIYTEEEKNDDRRASLTEARQMLIQWMAASAPQNVSRRFIAISVTIVWLGQYLIAMGMNVASVWVENPERYIETAKIINESGVSMNSAMMLILGFYFAGPYVGDFAKKALNNFSKKQGIK